MTYKDSRRKRRAKDKGERGKRGLAERGHEKTWDEEGDTRWRAPLKGVLNRSTMKSGC